MRDLVDAHFPKAEKIRVVLDNLSTHSPSALYQTSRRQRHTASCAASSSTTPQGTQAGLTWSRSKSASCEVSASTVASTSARCSSPRSPRGNARETKAVHASIGCSPPKKHAQKWPALTQPQAKSHNPCAEVLVPQYIETWSPRLKIVTGDRVEMTSPHGLGEGAALVVDTVRPGEVFTSFHYGRGA